MHKQQMFNHSYVRRNGSREMVLKIADNKTQESLDRGTNEDYIKDVQKLYGIGEEHRPRWYRLDILPDI
ncbi:hypothetical protein BT69DRAFT_1280200 [Atractiella rhizophila]|nr:hypothetical protein BT69DRAFT_1280200 [Atractiella rhizophila]